ncbi:unannotated protein [freshwater metagenome]|uniref:Unannotated protein n=1 Tax=freshwater metagenome TaxID=449393 RepID=A0A6J7GGL1_9ZZZZ
MFGPEHTGLSIEAVDRAPHIWLAKQNAGIVDEVASCEVICAINDQVVLREQLHHVRGIQPHFMHINRDEGVDFPNRVASALGLGTTDIALTMNDLSLQV